MGYICDYCKEHRSMVYCQKDSASLCVSCDHIVHSANYLSRRHTRTLLCERCASQPAMVRCLEEYVSLCQSCDYNGHAAGSSRAGHKRETVSSYSGCPSLAELSKVWPFIPDIPDAAPEPNYMANEHDKLEKKLQGSDGTPVCLPLEFLKVITSNFSTELVLGEGGYGVVYKGVLRCGKIIAVKKLFEIHLKEETFQNEVNFLIHIKHQNVVELIGYCAESTWEVIEHPSGSGKYIFAEIPKRLLCFEYIPNKSLDKHISDDSLGLEWNMRYKIIKGICNGLHFLHEKCCIVHLDLKPENILMDSTMTPKIADFGLSRIFGKQESRIVTNNLVGTRGYMAPEYLTRGVVSKKADIFSLGVIFIEIITGHKDYPFFWQDSPHSTSTSLQQFMEKVLESWGNRFTSIPKCKSMERDIQQVKQCIDIALNCVDPRMEKRPTTKDISQILNAADQVCSLR
uniref:Uncharacterized protein n=1 Tax=Avena sativa TaxID=4498 RepID=A0ACD5VAC1_AVESA